MKHLLYYTHSFIHVKVFVLNPILSCFYYTDFFIDPLHERCIFNTAS